MKGHWGRRELGVFEITKRKSHLGKGEVREKRESKGQRGWQGRDPRESCIWVLFYVK